MRSRYTIIGRKAPKKAFLSIIIYIHGAVGSTINIVNSNKFVPGTWYEGAATAGRLVLGCSEVLLYADFLCGRTVVPTPPQRLFTAHILCLGE